MTPLSRALLGAAATSCIVLVAHPVSRAFLTGIFPKPNAVKAIRSVGGPTQGNMDVPKSVAEAALWMQLASAKIESGQRLSSAELQSLVHLSEYMGQCSLPGLNERDNAFWPQMTAVFLDKLGDSAGASRQWELAANRNVWRDYESSRLLGTGSDLDQADGQLAWHLAGLYYQRRFWIGPAIRDYAAKALALSSESDEGGLLFRYDSLRNAQLIAQGARSIHVLAFAVEIGDLASRPPGGQPIADRAGKEKARGKLYDALNKVKLTVEASAAKSIYDDIDSRSIVTHSFRPTQYAARISALSILTATLPGSLLAVALLGSVLWPLGLLVLRYSAAHHRISWPPALAFGGALSVGVFALTLLPLASLVVLLCGIFLTFTPRNERSKYPSDFEPLFTWVVAILALAFVGAIALFFALVSTPGRLLVPQIANLSGIPGFGSPLVAVGLAAILFSLLLLLAPMWAFGKRVSTPFALGQALKTFGISLLVLGLAGVVILTPVCVYVDGRVHNTMIELVGNEPEHYVNIFS